MGGSNNEHYIRMLKSAIFLYLDDGLIDELVCDLREIFKEEEEFYKSKRENFKKARKILCGDKE